MPDLSIIPAQAAGDARLTASDVRVLCAIGIHTDREGRGAWASATTLAGEGSVSRNRFFQSTRRLEETGYIKRESRLGQTSVYRIVLDLSTGIRPTTKTGTPPTTKLVVGPTTKTGTLTSPGTTPVNGGGVPHTNCDCEPTRGYAPGTGVIFWEHEAECESRKAV